MNEEITILKNMYLNGWYAYLVNGVCQAIVHPDTHQVLRISGNTQSTTYQLLVEQFDPTPITDLDVIKLIKMMMV